MENLTEERVLNYLLGELPEHDQLVVEERYIIDSVFHTLLCEVEDDLIADYVRGHLTPDERQRFEGHYLPSESNRQRVRFAQVFLHMIDQAAEALENSEPVSGLSFWKRLSSSRHGLRGSMGLLAALLGSSITLGGIWLIRGDRRLQEEIAATRLESSRRESELLQMMDNEKRHNGQLAGEVERLRKQVRLSTVVSRVIKHVMVAETLRDEKALTTPSLIIPPQTEIVQLIYKMEDSGYTSYRAQLYSSSGGEVWSCKSIRPKLNHSVATFTITLPANKFDDAYYTLAVSGLSKTGDVDLLGKPTFQVEKR
ncbi:MAG: zf-HC2 domain-containing protein [Blastocatellia bacterium]|nr:zf-HC2 domain-containing protein [Blastocatellia bacterium]